MSLREWCCDHDKFEPEEGGLSRFAFPCCACKHGHKTDSDEPCRSCGHNLAATAERAQEADPECECGRLATVAYERVMLTSSVRSWHLHGLHDEISRCPFCGRRVPTKGATE